MPKAKTIDASKVASDITKVVTIVEPIRAKITHESKVNADLTGEQLMAGRGPLPPQVAEAMARKGARKIAAARSRRKGRGRFKRRRRSFRRRRRRY